jgi:hypothetical protein
MISTTNEIKNMVNYITAPSIDKCDAVNKILDSICLTPLTDTKYASLLKYRNDFLQSMLKEALCYKGVLIIDIATPSPYGPYEWARITKNFVSKNTCVNNALGVKQLTINFVPYSNAAKTDDIIRVREYLKSFEKVTGHSNMLLYSGRTIKRIEPNGSAPWDNIVDNTLEKYFSETEPGYRYISTMASCPVGVQGKTQDEFCENWSLLLIYIITRCPGMSYEEVQRQLIQKPKEYLQNLMNHWSCFMEEYIMRHGIDRIVTRQTIEKAYSESDRVARGMVDNPETLRFMTDVEKRDFGLS